MTATTGYPAYIPTFDEDGAPAVYTGERYPAYVPEAVGHEPATPREALLSAAVLLEEEGRWLQGDFYKNHAAGTAEYVDNPYCNGWGCCAIGALQVVTLGMRRIEQLDYDAPFDAINGKWPTKLAWVADEDGLVLYVENCATDEEWASLDDRQRSYIHAHQALDKVARAAGHGGTTGYNDDPGTTRADIVALFRTAAADIETDEANSDG